MPRRRSEPEIMSSRRRVEGIPPIPSPRLDPGIVEGSEVEIIGGAFRGKAARVTRITESKEEVTVELYEAKVPLALTVLANQVELKLERGCMVRIYPRGERLCDKMLRGRRGRVVAIDEEAGEVRVRVYDRKVIEHIEWIRNNGVENASYVFTVSTESVTITHCLTRALRVYCRHCDRLQGGGPRGLCEEHEERTEAIYQSLNGPRPMEEEE